MRRSVVALLSVLVATASLVVVVGPAAGSDPSTVPLDSPGDTTRRPTTTEAPLAEAGLDQNVSLGATVLLDATGSRDPDGSITSYVWSVETPDGSPLTPRNASKPRTRFEPTQLGTYVVELAVTDDDGQRATDRLYVHVAPGAPPTIELSGPASVRPTEPHTYTARLDRGAATLSHVVWRIDGRQVANYTVGPDASVVRYTTDFASPDVHDVTATVYDASGQNATASTRVVVLDPSPPDRDPPDPDPPEGNESNATEPRDPIARLTANRTDVTVGQTVSFDASNSSDPDGEIAAYDWAGASGSGSTVTESFDENGTHEVVVTVSDNASTDGTQRTDTASVTIVVGNATTGAWPSAEFTYSPTTPNTTEQVEFDASGSSAPNGGDLTYRWSIEPTGGGAPVETSGPTPTHTWTESGSYAVQLTVVDELNRTATDSAIVSVTNSTGSDNTSAGGSDFDGGSGFGFDMEGPTEVTLVIEDNGVEYSKPGFPSYEITHSNDDPGNYWALKPTVVDSVTWTVQSSSGEVLARYEGNTYKQIDFLQFKDRKQVWIAVEIVRNGTTHGDTMPVTVCKRFKKDCDSAINPPNLRYELLTTENPRYGGTMNYNLKYMNGYLYSTIDASWRTTYPSTTSSGNSHSVKIPDKETKIDRLRTNYEIKADFDSGKFNFVDINYTYNERDEHVVAIEKRHDKNKGGDDGGDGTNPPGGSDDDVKEDCGSDQKWDADLGKCIPINSDHKKLISG